MTEKIIDVEWKELDVFDQSVQKPQNLKKKRKSLVWFYLDC